MSESLLPAGERLKARLDELPALPGVYLMKDAKDNLIYVGKAKLLNRRVKSYFLRQDHNGHRAAELMVPHIRNIEWILCGSEDEALVLEANLIRKHRPKYNVRLKDDKHHPYLCVTTREPFPRVIVVRAVRDDGNLYFGPFLNARAMRALLESLPKLFRIRDCDLKLPLNKPQRPCLQHFIGRCDAPCADMCTREEYGLLVKDVARLLGGQREDILTEWREEMMLAAADQRFEDAARVRDRMQGIDELTRRRNSADASDASVFCDAVAVRRADRQACVVILEYRAGVLQGRKHFPLECGLGQGESDILEEFLPAWYLEAGGAPPEILLEHDLEDGLAQPLAEAISQIAARKVRLVVPQRGDKPGFLRLAAANAEMLLVEMVGDQERYDRIENSVFDLQRELGLERPPLRIECFDISHLSGTDTVASMVNFVHGRPNRAGYRRFRVKTVVGVDDFASMHEILQRRIARLQKENQPYPDLIVIDGGKGQVHAAHASLVELGAGHVPMIGLAKRLEEIVFHDERENLLLKRNNPALQLLQRARDEAHRFAITFQRESRRKQLKVEWMEGIAGFGPTLKTKVLMKWRTPEALLAAAPGELEELVGPQRAEQLREELRKRG